MAEDLLDLTAPGGCDEANHGTMRYRVDNDGHVRVPREAAHYLIRYAGFRPAPMPAADSAPRKDGDGAQKPTPYRDMGSSKSSPVSQTSNPAPQEE